MHVLEHGAAHRTFIPQILTSLYPFADLELGFFRYRVVGDMRVVRPLAIRMSDPYVVVVTVLCRASRLLLAISVLDRDDLPCRRRDDTVRRHALNGEQIDSPDGAMSEEIIEDLHSSTVCERQPIKPSTCLALKWRLPKEEVASRPLSRAVKSNRAAG